MAGKSVNRTEFVVPSKVGDSAIRCCYVHLAKARAYQEGSAPKYSITMMFDKSNPEHIACLKKLKADLIACREEMWPDVNTRPRTPIVAENPGEGPDSPIKDGDVAVNKQRIPIKEANPEYVGHFIVMASANESQGAVPVFGGEVDPDSGIPKRIDPNLCRSGFWYKVNINAFAYSVGNGGVTVGLNGVQLIREGDVLGGGGPATKDLFDPVAGTDPSLYSGSAEESPASAWVNGGAGDGTAKPAPVEPEKPKSLI